MKNPIAGLIFATLAALSIPAMAADTVNAAGDAQAPGAAQPDTNAKLSSKKGYDHYKAQSDMKAAAPTPRAPAGVTHEYHRTTGACARDGADADCHGAADDDSARKPAAVGAQGQQ
jgi:hypothetical protein